MRTVIDGVRRRASDDPAVSIIHTDLPTNDFDPLFTLLASPDSYLQGTSNVFAYAGGKSFYERLFPAAQLNIGWNAIAVHWLSRVPATIADHIWSNRATGTVKEDFARQSERDWQAFLDRRGQELRPGGCLVVLGAASDDERVAAAARASWTWRTRRCKGWSTPARSGPASTSGDGDPDLQPHAERIRSAVLHGFKGQYPGTRVIFRGHPTRPVLARVRAKECCPGLWYRLRRILPGCLRAFALRGARR